MSIAPRQKPPLGCRLNRRHPLAREMVSAWLLNEGGGLRVTDAVNGRVLKSGATSSVWVPGRGGPAWKLTNGGAAFSSAGVFLQELNFDPNAPFTFHFVVKRTTATAAITLLSLTGGGRGFGISTAPVSNTVQIQQSDSLSSQISAVGSYTASGVAAPAGFFHSVLFTKSGANVSTLGIYINGSFARTSTTGTSLVTGFAPVYDSLSLFGNGLAGTTEAGESLCIWRRALQQQEAMMLALDPYVMFR